MAASKRHHFLPQSYLLRFLDPNKPGFLWVYQRGSPGPVARKPLNTAVVGRYYTARLRDGSTDSEGLEHLFSNIEGKAVPVFDKVARREPLTKEDRWNLAVFLAVMLIRVPRARKTLERLHAAAERERLIRQAAEPSFDPATRFKAANSDTPPASERLAEHLRTGQFEVEGDPMVSLRAITLVPGIASILIQMRWTFLHAPSGAGFVTSDDPLQRIDAADAPRLRRDVWLEEPGVEVTFPMSPQTALLATWLADGEPHLSADKDLVQTVNYRSIAGALSYVYASEASDQIEALVQAFAHAEVAPLGPEAGVSEPSGNQPPDEKLC